MKKHEIIFGSIKVPLDFILVIGSFFLAREMRQISDLIPHLQLPIQTLDTYSVFIFSMICALILSIIFSVHGLYFINISHSKIKESLSIIRYTFYAFVFFAVFAYGSQDFIALNEIPRLMILFSLIITTLLLILERIIINNVWYLLTKKGIIDKKKIILVNNKSFTDIQHIYDDIKKAKIYSITGYINTNEGSSENIKYIGSINEAQKIFEKYQVDEILYIDSDFSEKERMKLWELSKIFGIRYRYITNAYDITKTNSVLGLIDKIPVIEIQNTSLDNWGRVYKRFFDICSGVLGCIIFAPIMLIIAILIKIDDPKAPVIYKNKRIGQDGKIFSLFKFRYLKWEYCIKDGYGVPNEKDPALKYEKSLIKEQSSRKGPLYKIKNDPRKTKIGNCIEKYSLDELPQFFNVIIGNMSLVGPRPHQPREVLKYNLSQKRLLTIKPGITGMAQVNGRENNDFETESKLDIFYIENWSLLIDLKIILKTFGVILKR